METSPDTLPPLSTERSVLAAAVTTEGRANRLRYLTYLMSYFPLIMILGGGAIIGTYER